MSADHDENRHYPCLGDRHELTNRYGCIPTRRRGEALLWFFRRTLRWRPGKESVSAVSRPQINCSALPCGWWPAERSPLADNDRARDRFLSAVLSNRTRAASSANVESRRP